MAKIPRGLLVATAVLVASLAVLPPVLAQLQQTAEPPKDPSIFSGKDNKGTLMGVFLSREGKMTIDVANPYGDHEPLADFPASAAHYVNLGAASYELPTSTADDGYLYMTRRITTDDTKINVVSVNVKTGAIRRSCVFDYAFQSIAIVKGTPETLVAVGYVSPVFDLRIVRIRMDTCDVSPPLIASLDKAALNPLPGLIAYDNDKNAVIIFTRDPTKNAAADQKITMRAFNAGLADVSIATLEFPADETPIAVEYSNGYTIVSVVKILTTDATEDGRTMVRRFLLGAASFSEQTSGSGLTAKQTAMFVSGVNYNAQTTPTVDQSPEIVMSVRHDVPPAAIPEYQVLGKPMLIETDPAPTDDMPATIAASSNFKSSPIALFFGPAPLIAENGMEGCVGFSGVVAQYPFFTVEHALVTPISKCRWVAQGTGTFKGTTTLVATTTAKRVFCEVPVLPDEPRASLLQVSLSNDGYHYSDRKFNFPIYDPRLNITDQLMRTVENYYSMDLGINANVDILLSSPAASGAQFSSTSLSFKNVREINAGFMKFTKLGVNTITGTVAVCDNSKVPAVTPTGTAPKFTITVTVKEFVGSDLPPNLVNNLPPRAVTVYLGDEDPAKRVRYNVTLIASVTSGGAAITAGTMIFNFEHTKSFNLVGTQIGPLEISLVPSGPNADQFTVRKLTTSIVSLNITLNPSNILLDRETTVTVTLNRDSSVRLDLAMDGTGTITPSILFRESSVATFKIRSTAYGLIKVSFTPNNANPLESPDFSQFAVVQKEILCAEVVNATTLSPRLPRPLPAEVLVTTSSNMNVEFRVDILSGSATVGGLSASNRVVLANSNSTKFTFTALSPGLVKYRLVAVAGDILLGAGTTPRFAPSDFEIVVNPIRLSLDLAPAIVQNELQTVTASIDLASNVTFALVADAGANTGALALSRQNLSYPNVDTDRFTLLTAKFGPIRLTFTVDGLNKGDFPAVQTFDTVVGGSVRADLPASVFVSNTRLVTFTLSGNASVAFDVTATSGVVVSASRLGYQLYPNVTLNSAGYPVIQVNATFAGPAGLASITLSPVANSLDDSKHFGPIVFTTNVVPDPQIACATGLSTCPDRVSCRADLADCPTQSQCPINLPVRCTDGQCARSLADCEARPLPQCANNGVRCPADLSCAATVHECPTSVTCPATLPVKCYDGTCRASINDCADAPICPVGQFQCPSGSCAASANECPKGRVCAQGQTLCPDLTCKASRSLCAAGTGSPIENAVCPPALPTLCPDLTCLPAGTSCPKPACPADKSVRCETGECAASTAGCASTNGCPADRRVKCPDGTCVAAAGNCASNQATCPRADFPALTALCPDGSCASSAAACPSEAGCPADAPMLCADKVNCVNLGVQSCPPAEVCDPRAPFRCDSGLCVASKLDCPVAKPLPRCTGETPVACADGSCAASSAGCFTIKQCPADRPFRCASGECRSDASRCPATQQGTCSKSQGYPLQCPRGECAATSDQCASASGCPVGAPFKCPGGTCAANEAACAAVAAAQTSTSAGCPVRTPFKCPDGSCVTLANSDSVCVALGGCPLNIPVRCNDGSCAATKAQCDALPTQSCPSAKPLKCPNGACEADRSACRTDTGCPLSTPHRCSDGSCRARPSGEPGPDTCPTQPTCDSNPATPHLCADGSCSDSAANCRPLPPCPANQPTRCPNSLECRASAADCERFRCPLGAPVFCVDTGECVKSASMCESPHCPDSARPFRCAWGTCVASYSECAALGSCASEFLPFLCPDGSCRIDTNDCPRIMACPSQLPHRCEDGTCASSANACAARRRERVVRRFRSLGLPAPPSPTNDGTTTSTSASTSSSSTSSSSAVDTIPASIVNGARGLGIHRSRLAALQGAPCAEGETRCADGQCVPTTRGCVAYFGCAGSTPYQCPSGLCAKDALGCSAGCGDGEFRCRDNTCRRVASDCPAHRIPVLSGVVVTHLVGASATYEILSASGVEADVVVPAGSINSPMRVVHFSMLRRPRSELASAPWDADANLVTSVFDFSAYTADRITLAPSTVYAMRSPMTVGWSAAGLLTSQLTDLCLSAMSSDLLQLASSGCTSQLASRGGTAVTGTTSSLGPHGVVRTSATFGAINSGGVIAPPDTSGSSGLSGGAIVGIVFACLFVLLLIVLLILFLVRRQRSQVQALKDACADKVSKQAALVEIAEDDSISLKDKNLLAGAPSRSQKAAQAAQAPGAPLSVPVLAPKPRVKTIDTLPPLVTKRPPQTVVPYRTNLPTLFASDAGKAAAPLVDARKPKTVDLATLHRTTTEGLERSGAEDERPVFQRQGSSAIHGSNLSTSSYLASRTGAGPGSPSSPPPPRTPSIPASQRKGRLFANAVGSGSTQAMPELPERPSQRAGGHQPVGIDAGVEDEAPSGFGLGPTAVDRVSGGQARDKAEERLPGHIQDDDEPPKGSFEKVVP